MKVVQRLLLTFYRDVDYFCCLIHDVLEVAVPNVGDVSVKLKILLVGREGNSERSEHDDLSVEFFVDDSDFSDIFDDNGLLVFQPS